MAALKAAMLDLSSDDLLAEVLVASLAAHLVLLKVDLRAVKMVGLLADDLADDLAEYLAEYLAYYSAVLLAETLGSRLV